jgi:5-methylcytosine-specific restriction endonuclease McrBC GTP-binding regulatory subunit McrB
MTPLDIEEQDILESFENGEWKSAPNVAQEIQRYQSYAQPANLESLNIEIPASDFQSLRLLAEQTNTSVALLVANVLHQYVVHQSSIEPVEA